MTACNGTCRKYCRAAYVFALHDTVRGWVKVGASHRPHSRATRFRRHLGRDADTLKVVAVRKFHCKAQALAAQARTLAAIAETRVPGREWHDVPADHVRRLVEGE